MGNQKLILSVKGMTCDHCKKAVEKAVGRITGVKNVSVELDLGLVTVATDGQKDLAQEIKGAIEEAGYTVENVNKSCC